MLSAAIYWLCHSILLLGERSLWRPEESPTVICDHPHFIPRKMKWKKTQHHLHITKSKVVWFTLKSWSQDTLVLVAIFNRWSLKSKIRISNVENRSMQIFLLCHRQVSFLVKSNCLLMIFTPHGKTFISFFFFLKIKHVTWMRSVVMYKDYCSSLK